jgi:thiol:disulfide interchange protein
MFLAVGWVLLIGYTALVIAHHGMGFLPVFFGDIARAGWAGQFNADFSLMLLLAAIWVAWRHGFSSLGLLLGALTVIGGAGFVYPYVLVASLQAKGDARVLLLGPTRMAA